MLMQPTIYQRKAKRHKMKSGKDKDVEETKSNMLHDDVGHIYISLMKCRLLSTKILSKLLPPSSL